jgi:hypothetical protein
MERGWRHESLMILGAGTGWQLDAGREGVGPKWLGVLLQNNQQHKLFIAEGLDRVDLGGASFDRRHAMQAQMRPLMVVIPKQTVWGQVRDVWCASSVL